jgi:hypothetical protein
MAIGSSASDFTLPGYDSTGASPFDFAFTNAALGGKLALLSFVRVAVTGGGASPELSLLPAIMDLASDANIVNVVVVGNPDKVSDPTTFSTDVTDAWIARNLPGGFVYDRSKMPILRIVPTGGAYTDPSGAYITPMGLSVTWPALFVLKPGFTFVDAFHLTSADTGNGLAPAASTGWSMDDYIALDWSTDTAAVKIGKCASYLAKRVLDLRTAGLQGAIAVSGNYIGEGSEFSCTLSGPAAGGAAVVSKQAVGAGAPGSYQMSGGGTFAKGSADGQYKLSDYLAGKAETRVIKATDLSSIATQEQRPFTAVNATISLKASAVADATGSRYFAAVSPQLTLLRKGAALFPRTDTGDDGHTPKPCANYFNAIDLVTMKTLRDANAAQALASDPSNNPSDAFDIVSGTSYYAHLRVKNAGAKDFAVAADPMSGTLYYFPSSTGAPITITKLGAFNFAGLTAVSSIRANFQNLVVTAPLSYAIVDSLRHYCYVASIGTADNPEPDLPALLNNTHSCEEWHTMLMTHFSTAWRNFNIVTVGSGKSASAGDAVGAHHGGHRGLQDQVFVPRPIPGAPPRPDSEAGWHAIPFELPGGFSRKDGPIQLKIKQSFPPQVKFYVDLPETLKKAPGKALKANLAAVPGQKGMLRAQLPANDHTHFEPLALKPRSSHTIWLHLYFPEGLQGSWNLEASSYSDGLLLGQATWRFVVDPEVPALP